MSEILPNLSARDNAKRDGKPSSMSALSEQEVIEFAAMWEEVYGEQLSTHEAKERAEQLVHFVLLMQRMGS